MVSDKISLHAWEMTLQKEHYNYSYNRIYFDNEVFKPFMNNGKIIKMLVDPKDL